MNNYLIPANTKRGQLIFSLFRPFDLILFSSGIFITLLLLLLLPLSSIVVAIIALSPALVTGFLVLPIPYYHNVLSVIVELIDFLSSQRKYRWRGWCYKYEAKQNK